MSVMTVSTEQVGRHGEEIAASYLRSKNYVILEQNARLGRYEIDIIAEDPYEKMMVFVEVKTRSHDDHRYPIRTAVDRRKRRALRKAVFRWVLRHEYDGPGRIDIVCIAGERIVDHVVNVGADFF